MTTIRTAVPGDASAMLDLHIESIRAFGPTAYDEAQVDAWARTDEPSYPIDDDEHAVIVAERDGVLVGLGDVHVPESEVIAVYIHPDHARCGVGSAILSHLESVARGRGLTELSLLASLNAVGFYERMGYERVECELHETSGVKLECVRMRTVI